jgi:(p)ppGpp synthase/HD superfamily hydrolase
MTSAIVEEARELAERAHSGQMRKAQGQPYFSHLQAVVELLAAHGCNDALTLAAAYLHDLIEDQPAFTAELERRLPAEVVDTVLALTEPKLDAQGRPRPKPERFEAYVRGLSSGSAAARRALPISCADKIHNALSLVSAEASGEGLLARMSTRPSDHVPQLLRLRALYAGAVPPRLLAAFDAATEQLRLTIEASHILT